jgi:hypothetical protein
MLNVLASSQRTAAQEENAMRTRVLTAAAIAVAALSGAFPATAQVQDRTIRWGHLNNADHPVSFGVQKFAAVLGAKSGGKLKVREFPASQLGNEMQMQSALRGGTQEMMSASTTSLASVVKDLGLFDFPFIVGTVEQAEALASGAFGQAMIDALPEKDLIGLGYWGLGFRNATNNVRPIAKVEDFAGLKLRVIPNPGLSRDLQGLQGEPGADEFRGALHRTRKQDRRWAGKPVQRDSLEQILRSAEIPVGDQPHLHAEYSSRQQEILGPALARGADDDPRSARGDEGLSA